MKKNSSHMVLSIFTSYGIGARMAFSILKLILKYYPLTKALKVFKQICGRKKTINGIHGLPKFFRSQDRIFYELNTPGWPSPAFTKFISTEINKNIKGGTDTNDIQNVELAITNKCSLNCPHCYEWDRLGDKERISSTQLQTISASLQKAGASIIQIGGGDPLERLGDLCILARTRKPTTDFWLLTSGYRLDRFKTEILKFAGYSGINISLDHWDAEKHNAFRGNDLSYRWVIDGAHNTLKSGLVLALSLCATKEFVTRENLLIYLELAKELKASFIQVLEAREAGRYKGKDVALSSDQKKMITDLYLEVNNNRSYRSYPTIIYHGAFQPTHGCLGAGSRSIYVDSHGNVHACPFCQESAGNMLKNNLADILADIRERGCHLYKGYSDH